MKFVQSLVTGNIKNVNSFLNYKIWGTNELQRKLHWYMWIWSFMSIYEKNCNIELVTDDIGKKILINEIKLPYKNVECVLNDIDQQFWFLAKIKAYSIQNEPFLHVDGDVVFQKYYPNDFKNYKLLCQNKYPLLKPNYEIIQKQLYSNRKKFKNIPEEYAFNPLFAEPDQYMSINCGVFGGNDILFINEYCNKILQFFDQSNKPSISELIYNLKTNYNIQPGGFFSFFEEFLLALMFKNKYDNLQELKTILSSKFENIECEIDCDEEQTKLLMGDYQQQSKEIGYIHLMDLKRNISYLDYNTTDETANNLKELINKIFNTVKEKYPEYTNRVDSHFSNIQI